MTRQARSPRARQRLRIIGGQWRGRRIDFLDLPQLRPTPDRVRETLFNWLQGFIEGSRCLDLFAGSGALGFEAASRGAASVTMVDVNALVVNHLRQQTDILSVQGVEVVQADALMYLRTRPPPFDIVFVDPPFTQRMVEDTCIWLERYGALKPTARIYIETDAAAGIPKLPGHWQTLRAKHAGQVAYYLVAAQP